MKRTDRILAGVLAVQVILSILIFAPKPAAGGEGGAAFPDLTGEDIVALMITDDQGSDITLQKQIGKWVLPDADDYPADATKVDPTLNKMAGLSTSRLVTRTRASHKRLQVAEDDFLRRIAFETEDGTKRTVFFGSAPSYGATHFRVEGQDEVYLANDFSVWDINTTAAGWVSTSLFTLNSEDVTQAILTNSNGRFTFLRDDEGNWSMEGLAEGEELAPGEIDTIINRATSVTMLRPLGKEEKPTYGMADPIAVVMLDTVDEDTILLRVGAQDPEDNSYVVKAAKSPYFAQVAEYNVQAFVENTRDDFIQPPATPMPEGEEATS